jgi:hypothetical protein
MAIKTSNVGDYVDDVPLVTGDRPVSRSTASGQAVAVGPISLHLPLTQDEKAICARMHCRESEFIAARARMRAGKDPLSNTSLGMKIDGAANAGPRGHGGGGFRER